MAAKPKAKKKQTTSGRAPRNKVAPIKKTARKKLASKAQVTKKKQTTSGQAPRNKVAPTKKTANKKLASKGQVTKKKQTTSEPATGKKVAPIKKTARKNLASKGQVPKKKQTASGPATRHKVAPTKKTAKKKLASKGQVTNKQVTKADLKEAVVKAVRKKSISTRRRAASSTSPTAETAAFSPKELAARSGGQSGDLQGLSSVEAADSESVVELLEEGNAFEAAVVAGVEDAGNPREVRTHELLEDDVPDEYLDRE